jgi:hypothetical protein
MDIIKTEPDSDEDFLSEEQQLIDVKLEDDPVPEPFCIVKTEAYDTCWDKTEIKEELKD